MNGHMRRWMLVMVLITVFMFATVQIGGAIEKKVIGEFRGVEAYSNGPCTAKFSGIHQGINCSKPKNRPYQCVEYVKRFYTKAMHMNVTKWYGKP